MRETFVGDENSTGVPRTVFAYDALRSGRALLFRGAFAFAGARASGLFVLCGVRAEEGAKAAAGARVDARQFSRLFVEFVGERGQLRAERFDPVAFLARVADLGLEFGEGDFVQRKGRVLRPHARDLLAIGQYTVKRVFRRHEEIVSFELKKFKR